MNIAITGAATGIGAATVRRLRSEGHHITAFDVVEPNGVDVWVKLDLSDLDAIPAAVQAADGSFDALINNAGLPPRGDNQLVILAVNVLGLIALTLAMEPKLTPGAAIVSTASRAGRDWMQNLEEVKALLALRKVDELPKFVAEREIDATRAYNLSKEAVIAWTIAQTVRWIGLGLRGNTVSPAAVDTRILADFEAAFGERVAQIRSRVGRSGAPEEIAETIAFLASPTSNWIKGTDIWVDGGATAITLADAHRLTGEK